MDSYEIFLKDLKNQLDLDLTGYKRPQMERRINSLMRTLGVADYQGLVGLMVKERTVFERFLDHLTINVSEFFRNSGQWDVLQKQIIPGLLEDSPNLKIWSAGCSTGEEPYTLAMILAEQGWRGQHTILATDFDDRVLKKAQEGFYHARNIVGLSDHYLKRYFQPEKDGYRVKEDLKKAITFRRHNLLRDPFPDNLDLIVCRNVVIYFTEETKNTLYRRFYNALRPRGVLFTGSTEQIITSREIGYESPAIFFYSRPR